MKKVLVSGASGVVGYGILRSLKRSTKEIQLIGTSIYEDSVANAFCDIFEKAPPTTDKEYVSWLLEIIRKHRVDFIIPGIEVDLYSWVEHLPEIEASGVKILMNNVELVKLCKDKWIFYEKMLSLNCGFLIESSLDRNFDSLASQFGLPFLLKPRQGFGGRGIITVVNYEIFEKYAERIGPELMAQPIVGDVEEEYTTSAFCDGKGSVYASMTLRRKLSKEGFTDRATVVSPEGLSAIVSTLCRDLQPLGPTNFQFRRSHGNWKLLEVNPRISSATSIRSSFGYNESMMAVEFWLENKIPAQPDVQKGRAVRYVEDFIFYENRPDL